VEICTYDHCECHGLVNYNKKGKRCNKYMLYSIVGRYTRLYKAERKVITLNSSATMNGIVYNVNE
jgi:hypothetical protein